MVGVVVGEEDLPKGEAHPVAHHLALGPLAAIEQHRLPFAGQREGGDVAVEGGARGAGAQKGELQHGGKVGGNGERGTGSGEAGNEDRV